ncbi:MAG: hypothetical protein KDA75_16080, partial [Planctomycetaceae bacterium]|nr:hypothetical protein [Planctomycetaceae bacterium]
MTAGRTTHSDRRRSLLVSGLGLVWTLIFGAFFFSQTVRTLPRQAWLLELPTLLGSNFTSADNAGWRYLPQRFDLLLCAIVILAAAWGLGRTLLLGLRTQLRFRSAEGAALTMGLGLSAWSLVTLGLGLAGWLDQWLFVACAAAFVVLGVFCDVRQRSHAEQRGARSSRGLKPPDSPAKAEETLPLRRLVLLSSFPFVLAMLLGSMLPSTDFDVKEYHLEGPKEYFLGGRVRMLPHNVYTSFPFLTEMLSLSAMVIRSDWWRGALAGKVVLMTYSMITSLGLFAIARRLAGETVGWLAVLIWLTTPWTYRISTIAYAEGGLTCYLVLTLLGLVMWRDRSLRVGGWGFTEEPDESPGEVSRPPTCPGSSGPWIFLTGLLAGSAAACKYPGVLSAVIPVGLTVLWIAGRSGKPSSFQWKRCLATGALYSAGVLVTFGPWLLKNLIETGNPVYPLLWSVLGGESFDAATNARWKAGHAPPTWLLQQPSQILPDLWQRLQDIFLRSDWQTPLLGALLPFSLLAWQRIRGLRWVWAYVLWLFFTWLWM